MEIDTATGFQEAARISSTAVPPSGVRYGDLLPLGTRARSFTRRFIPTNGQVFTYNTRVIRVELNGPFFMDPTHSFLKFDVQLRGDATAQSVAASVNQITDVFERIIILGPDGSELERLDNYNVLSNLLNDFTLNYSHNEFLTAYTEGTYLDAAGTSHDKRPGTVFGNTTGVGADFANSPRNRFCVQLKSGLLANSKYLPLLALRGSGLTVELHLADGRTAFDFLGVDGAVYDQPLNVADNYQITNVEYVAHCVDFDETFNRQFLDVLRAQGQLQWHGVTHHNFSYATLLTAGTTTIPIAERARSLKHLLVSMRNSNRIGNVVGDSFIRVRSGVSQYVFNIGGARFPQAPVRLDAVWRGASEGMIEVMKCFAPLTAYQYGGRARGYPTNPSGAIANQVGYESFNFAVGLNLENFPQDMALLESGMDTLSQSLPIYLELTCASGIPEFDAAAQRDIQVFSAVDVIYILSADGLMSASD